MNITVVKDKYQIKFAYSPTLVTEVKSSFERPRWDPKAKCWNAPITPRNNFLVQLHTGQNPYERWDQDIDLEAFKVMHEEAIRKLVPELTLRNYQWEMLAHSMIRQRFINGAWMRMGKTIPTLLGIVMTGIRGAWFVTSVSAMTGIKQEMSKWKINPDIYLLTYDAFTKVVNDDPDLIPQLVILDEGQAIKAGSGSLRGLAARECTKVQMTKFDNHPTEPKPSYFWLLSGTPDPNNPCDWWNICEAVAPGFLKEGNLNAFKRRVGFFTEEDGLYGGKYLQIDKKQGRNGWNTVALRELGERLSGLVKIFRPEDYGRPSAPEHEVVRLAVPKAVKSAIKMLRKLNDGLALRQVYRQLDDGFQYEHGKPDVVTLKSERTTVDYGSPKYGQFKSDLSYYEDVGRLVCYAFYTESLDRLNEIAIKEGWAVLSFSGKGRRALGTSYTADELQESMDYSLDKRVIPKIIVICQSTTGNEGQEFSSADCTIMFSYPDRSDAYEQSCARMSSGASPNPKVIRHYEYLGIGKIMKEALALKKDIQKIPKDVLVNALQADLDNEIEEEFIPMNFKDMKS